MLFHKLNTKLTFTAEQVFGKNWKTIKEKPMLAEFLLASTVDLLLHPLHVAETRIVLQNRTSNFRVYQSLTSFFTTTPLRDMARGCLLHMPKNFLVGLSSLKV